MASTAAAAAAAAVCVCYCAWVGGGFTLPWGSGSRESAGEGGWRVEGGGTVWDCQDRLIKRPQERDGESDWAREGKRRKKKRGGRTERQGEGGEGSERRRTMRLLMRTFWGAYVGHCMNKQTFTTLNWWFTHTHTQPHTHTHSHVVLFMFPILPLTHMASTYHEVHTHIKTERRCLVFIVYASPFHSFMDVALSCPLFKLVGLVIHIKFGRVSFSHTLIVLPFGSLFFIHSMYQLALSFFFFLTQIWSLKSVLARWKDA